ncbi:2Fe-2S ferredoxin-like [Argiope bruennichi]|uniref:2Fe-2S ferredoxin-like n=1 Tax=Argiope bruennichi TaxID=94029 RepID=UPI00249564E9|nr:2Fe-2S ferredoxin-like [Argiope bruennichi]
MSLSAISKNLFYRFFSYSYRQSVVVNGINNTNLRTHFRSSYDSKHWRYYCERKKWITIILEKTDGTHVKRKGEIGKTLYDALFDDPDFPEFGVCKGTMACSTCHVIFTKEDFNTISKFKKEDESEMDVLDDIANLYPAGDADFRTDTSRLGCCVDIIPEMDGMVIKLPKTRQLLGT